jgi:hypothetical protein
MVLSWRIASVVLSYGLARIAKSGVLARPGGWRCRGRDEPRGERMEHRECQNCGVWTQQERVDLTAQAVDWTVFVCTECGTMARARRSRPSWATAG